MPTYSQEDFEWARRMVEYLDRMQSKPMHLLIEDVAIELRSYLTNGLHHFTSKPHRGGMQLPRIQQGMMMAEPPPRPKPAKPKACTCGSAAVQSPRHSDWCDLG